MFQGGGSSRGDECSRGIGIPGGWVFQGDECPGGWVSWGMVVPDTSISHYKRGYDPDWLR